MSDDLVKRARDDAFLSRATKAAHELPRAELVEALADEIDRLRAENERLREALEKIASYRPMYDYTLSSRRGRIDEHMPGSPFDHGREKEAKHLSGIARAALQNKGDE